MTVIKRILGSASVIAMAVGTAWAGGQHQQQSSSMPPQGPLSFEQLDVNRDGQLSAAEYNSGVMGHGTSSQSSTASSGSGIGSGAGSVDSSSGAPVPSEQSSSSSSGASSALPGYDRGTKFSELDKNGDGAVSMEEGMSNPKIASGWDSADRDGDGQLSRSEFESLALSEGPLDPSPRERSLGS